MHQRSTPVVISKTDFLRKISYLTHLTTKHQRGAPLRIALRSELHKLLVRHVVSQRQNQVVWTLRIGFHLALLTVKIYAQLPFAHYTTRQYRAHVRSLVPITQKKIVQHLPENGRLFKCYHQVI